MNDLGLDVFPLGFWATQNADRAPAQQPAEWAEMGMSLTMGHGYAPGQSDKKHFGDLLENAEKNHVKIILCDERAQARTLRKLGADGYRKQLQAMAEDWKGFPAIWGVHLGDEPNKQDYPLFIEAIQMLRTVAPQWEPYVNLLPWQPGLEKVIGCDDWGAYLDRFVQDSGMRYLSYDNYTQMRPDAQAWPIYFRNLRLYGEAAQRSHIPFWTILLCVPHFTYRQPTLDDLRWQFNTALACGAGGISWFFLYCQDLWISNYRNAPVNQVGRKTETYYYISDIQNIFLRTLGPVLPHLTLEKVWHIGQAYGGFPLFEGDEEIVWRPGDAHMILSYFTGDDGMRYYMVVNNSCTESVHFSLEMRGAEPKAELLLHDGIWQPMQGFLPDDGPVEKTDCGLSMPHWYAPGQASLYRRKAD